jgi:hypothetical protein
MYGATPLCKKIKKYKEDLEVGIGSVYVAWYGVYHIYVLV